MNNSVIVTQRDRSQWQHNRQSNFIFNCIFLANFVTLDEIFFRKTFFFLLVFSLFAGNCLVKESERDKKR